MNLEKLDSENSLDRLMAEARRFPMLSHEKERDLATRWLQERDREALNQLVGSHLRLVLKMARGFMGYGLPLADLVSEGNVGLMRAAEKFDPDRGFRFSTYAAWWIRAAIQEHVLYSWSLVKIGTTAAQKKLFFNLRRLKAQLEEFEDGDLSAESINRIAQELSVPEDEVVEMNRRLMGGDFSLNGEKSEDSGNWLERLVDSGPTPEFIALEASDRRWRRRLLDDSLIVLNDRERHILRERRLREDPQTLQMLSEEYGISRERVRQIENRAIEKLSKAMRDAATNAARIQGGQAGYGDGRTLEPA